MIRRFIPSSLIGKISLIMLAGLLFELIIALQIFSSDREQMLNLSTTNNTLGRISALVNVLERTPQALHHDIIEAAQGSGLMLDLDNTAVINQNQRQDLSKKIQRDLAGNSTYHINIKSISSGHHHRSNSDKMSMKHMSTKHMSRMKSTQYKTQLMGSVQLGNRYWLNFSSAIDKQSLRWSWLTILALISVAVFTVSAMFLVVKRALNPIKDLAMAAQKMGQERDFTPLKVTGPDEILPTINAFNNMQTNLSQFVDDRTKMLAAISHDLRTPITSMRLRLEFIEHNDDQKHLLATLANMEAMITATLNFARDDAQQEPSQTIELTSLLQTISDDYQDQGHQIILSTSQKVVSRLSPIAFRRVMENLINNSFYYGSKEDIAVVELTCYQKDTEVVIQVLDNGAGIEEDELERVFKPFVRLGAERDTSSSSVGLGLSTSRSIIQGHGGTLKLRNRKEGGLCAEIRLPIMGNH